MGVSFQMRWLGRLALVGIILGWAGIRVAALPDRCEDVRGIAAVSERPLYCLALLTHDLPLDGGELAVTALAAAPDGTVYAASPLTGAVYALTPTGDADTYRAERIADGLTLPNALAWHDDTLYIAAGAGLYRWRDDVLTLLVDDLPSGAGFWTGGLAVGDDGTLYVGIGADCDACIPAEDRALILAFDADGGGRRVIARGLRHPAGLLWHDGALWVTDTADDRARGGRLDELNRITADDMSGTVPHFGWPYCVGAAHTPALPDAGFDCASAVAPVMTLPTRSAPQALAWHEGHLLVLLSGSASTDTLEGYLLAALPLDADGQPGAPRVVTPFYGAQALLNPLRAANRDRQYDGNGFWPHRLYGLTADQTGQLYISVGGGRIVRLRPLPASP